MKTTADGYKYLFLFLRYASGQVLIYGTHDPGFGQIWLDDVRCNGYETSLSGCPHRAWGSHDCSHAEDVYIFCSQVIPGTNEPSFAYNWTSHSYAVLAD